MRRVAAARNVAAAFCRSEATEADLAPRLAPAYLADGASLHARDDGVVGALAQCAVGGCVRSPPLLDALRELRAVAERPLHHKQEPIQHLGVGGLRHELVLVVRLLVEVPGQVAAEPIGRIVACPIAAAGAAGDCRRTRGVRFYFQERHGAPVIVQRCLDLEPKVRILASCQQEPRPHAMPGCVEDMLAVPDVGVTRPRVEQVLPQRNDLAARDGREVTWDDPPAGTRCKTHAR